MENYVLNQNVEACKKIVFDEYIHYIDLLTSHFLKSKSYEAERKMYFFKKVQIYILKGELGISTDLLLDNNIFYLTTWYSTKMSPYIRKTYLGTLRDYVNYPLIMSRNLYVAYKQIGFTDGCKELTKFYPEIRYPIGINKEEVISEYEDFKKGKFDNNYYFVKPVLTRINSRKSVELLVNFNMAYKMSDIVSNYYPTNKAIIIESLQKSFRNHSINLT